MKIYCYLSETDDSPAYRRKEILDVVERTGSFVITKDTPAEKAFPETFRQVERRGQSLLDFVDAMIIEGSYPDTEVGFLLAYAIAQKKPVMLLLRKGMAYRNPLATFGQKVPSFVKTVFYVDDRLETAVVRFLSSLGDITYEENPTIKFTLRITPKIEQYLAWKAKKRKATKADFLRQAILDELMKNDEEYAQIQGKGKLST